ncbi:MAG TPA: hypothetical protein VF472_06550 [Burkholderiaceae bacterium]
MIDSTRCVVPRLWTSRQRLPLTVSPATGIEKFLIPEEALLRLLCPYASRKILRMAMNLDFDRLMKKERFVIHDARPALCSSSFVPLRRSDKEHDQAMQRLAVQEFAPLAFCSPGTG